MAAGPQDLIPVPGYAGPGAREGYRRVYAEPRGAEYVDIPADRVARWEGAEEDGTPVTCWVQRGARLLHTRTVAAPGQFLTGDVTSALLGRAARADAGVRVGIDYPPTEDLLCDLVTWCSACISGMRPCPTGVGCGPL